MASPESLTVCVYGSSSQLTPQKYLDEAYHLGKLLAEGGHMCINGAGKNGCMGALNDGVQHTGGRVRGVIHAKWVVDQAEHPNITDLIIVEGDDLQERKKALVHGVDVIIALPGGPGTWDEMWEMACQRGVGFTGVPIVAVNVDGFYDGFVQQLKRAHEDGLLYLEPQDLVHFEATAAAALKWCVDHINSQAADAKVIPVKVERKSDAEHNKRGSLNFKVDDGNFNLEGATPLATRLGQGALCFLAGAALSAALLARRLR